MTEKHRLHDANFPSAREEASPRETEYPPAYRLAFNDQDFLLREELRGLRFHLELQKPEMTLKEHGVDATIAIFGSARYLSPDQAKAASAAAEASGDPAVIRRAKRDERNSHYYDQARRLGQLVTEHSMNCAKPEQIYVVTGFGLGEEHDGGYADYVRVPAAWPVARRSG